jgi:hypothetical protein
MRFAIIALACLASGPTCQLVGHHPPSSQPSYTATFGTKLATRVERFDISGRPLVAATLDLAYKYRVPVALEYADREATTEPIDLHLRNESVREIFETVVAKFPHYRVTFSGGIVDIYSSFARTDTSNLLNTVIENFSVTQSDTHQADMQLFCDLVRKAEPDGVCAGSIALGQWGTKKITLQLQNAKVYQILNAIVAQNGEAIWSTIVPPRELSQLQTGGIWHIYPLDEPYQAAVLDKLLSLGSDR